MDKSMIYDSGGQHIENSKRWHTEDARFKLFDYPLIPDSIVYDVGGYEGGWTERLVAYHNFIPFIWIFEPIPEYASRIRQKFLNQQKVVVCEYGLGARNEIVKFGINLDGSGQYSDGGVADVQIRDVVIELIQPEVDLMSINIEGGEYSLLSRMITTGLIFRIKNLQVQFHALGPDFEVQRNCIQKELNETHEKMYDYPFVWESWARKK
jgi:FkbM family methyltransferase